MMEFWLVSPDEKTKLRLPVLPPEFKVETGQKVTIVDVNDFGDYSKKGSKNADRITISTFFPNQFYSFCQYKNFPAPYDCVDMIQKWKDDDKPIRFIITETTLNKQFFVESFTYGERAGSSDVEFDLSLVEYRHIDVPKLSSSSSSNPRPVKTPVKPKTYTVKKGDTLWAIARNFYGDPYKWTIIASKNGIKDARKLQIGKVLVIP